MQILNVAHRPGIAPERVAVMDGNGAIKSWTDCRDKYTSRSDWSGWRTPFRRGFIVIGRAPHASRETMAGGTGVGVKVTVGAAGIVVAVGCNRRINSSAPANPLTPHNPPTAPTDSVDNAKNCRLLIRNWLFDVIPQLVQIPPTVPAHPQALRLRRRSIPDCAASACGGPGHPADTTDVTSPHKLPNQYAASGPSAAITNGGRIAPPPVCLYVHSDRFKTVHEVNLQAKQRAKRQRPRRNAGGRLVVIVIAPRLPG